MNIKKVTEMLKEQLPIENIRTNELMNQYTSFKIGGPADLFVVPDSIESLKNTIEACRTTQTPFYIIGNGSNLLIDDKGLRGVVIQIYKNLEKIEVEGTQLTAYSGALLSKVANVALERGLTGFEFAHGIPGTLGGAVTMNAGAYGGEIKDVIIGAQVMDQEGNVFALSKEDLELGYRTSSIQTKGYIVLKATLDLKTGNKEEIGKLMKELSVKRRDKQPLEMPSAGSAFKRPEGYFAGKLIMDAGLRGYKVGGAMVSEKHCGFVVSDGTATFEDVLQLIEDIRRIVKDKFEVELEPEVRVLKSIDPSHC